MTSRVPSLFAGTHCPACPASHVCTVAGTIEACGDKATEHKLSAHPSQSRASPEDFLLAPLKSKALPPIPGSIVVADSRVPGRVAGMRLRPSLRPGAWRASGPFKPIAVLHGSDDVLGRVWNRRVEVGENFRSWGVPAVIGPAFSTWWSDTPFASLEAMAKTAEAARIIGHDVPVVPSVVWRFEDDLIRWAAWLVEGDTEALAVDLGTLESRGEWSWGIRGLARLGELLRQNTPTLFANGPSTLARIAEVIGVWPGTVVPMSQHPWHLARHGLALENDLSASKDRTLTAAELVQINADSFDQAVRSLTRHARKVAA